MHNGELQNAGASTIMLSPKLCDLRHNKIPPELQNAGASATVCRESK